MKHTNTLLMKFVSCLIAFTIGLDLLFDATIADIISFSLLVSIVSYLLGDRIILPIAGNVNALVGDFILTYMSVWIFGSVLLDNYLQIAWGSIISASLITASEVIIHRYMINKREITKKSLAGFNPKMAYGMEMAKEQDPRFKK